MDLISKIEYEYECFYLDQMRTSRENIFARSGEIELKKKLASDLRELAGEADETKLQLLLSQTNLLESYYRYYMDAIRREPNQKMQEVRESWIIFLTLEREKVSSNTKKI